MCFLSLSCHEPSLVQPTTKMDPSQKFPGWTRKKPFLGPQDLNPHPGAMDPKDFSFSSWTIVFPTDTATLPDRILPVS